MRHLNHRSKISALALALLVSACATPTKDESPDQGIQQQIATAEREGSLESLFEKYATEAAKTGIGTMLGGSKDAAGAKALVGTRLANVRRDETRALFKQSRLASGQIPLDVVAKGELTVARMARWDADIQAQFSREVADEKARTQASLDRAQRAFNGMDATALVARHGVLAEIAALHGKDTSEGQAATMRQGQVVKAAFDAGVQALRDGQIAEAEASFAAVATVAPRYPDLEKRQAELRGLQFNALARDRSSLEDVDSALGMYEQLKGRADFAALKPNLAPGLASLYEFALAKGDVAASEERYADAYAWFTRLATVRSLKGGQASISPEEKRFADSLFLLARKAVKTNQPGLALGYLFVAQDIYPDYPGLKKTIREVHDQTLDRAVKKITAANFTGAGDFERMGGSVASKLTQLLFKALPDDVRIVERDQLQAIIREQEIVSMQGSANVNLASADYVVQGAILESTVETTEKKGKKTVRVVTRKNRKANPLYAEWAQGPRTTPEPDQFIEDPVEEDIGLNVTQHRKVGVLSVSYRIVDSATARVLFTDNVSRKKSESGESTEGVQLGEFTVPMKIAELPSDSEILEGLAAEVAAQISTQMVDFLRDPEVKYQAQAEKLVAEENQAAAAEMLAKAWVMAKRKGKQLEGLDKQLREMSLVARPNT